MQAKREGIIYIISAPSGTGKSTVCKILLEREANLKVSVSHTTRTPRPKEIHGKDYYFVSEKEFKQKIEANHFLEWAKVHNEYYGTARTSIEEKQNDNHDIIIEIDVQGVETLRKIGFWTFSSFFFCENESANFNFLSINVSVCFLDNGNCKEIEN